LTLPNVGAGKQDQRSRRSTKQTLLAPLGQPLVDVEIAHASRSLNPAKSPAVESFAGPLHVGKLGSTRLSGCARHGADLAASRAGADSAGPFLRVDKASATATATHSDPISATAMIGLPLIIAISPRPATDATVQETPGNRPHGKRDPTLTSHSRLTHGSRSCLARTMGRRFDNVERKGLADHAIGVDDATGTPCSSSSTTTSRVM
jgi:hypothetical protein